MNPENLRQLVIPHTLFVGDTGEIKIYFASEEVFSNATLSQEFFTSVLAENDYSIKKLSISKNGTTADGKNSYEFSMTFTPWKTGKNIIPSYNLGKFAGKEDFCVTFDSINVESIFTQKNVDQTFQGARGPLLLPGTTYKIFLWSGIFLILIILLIRWLVKWQDFILFVKNQRLMFMYRQNKKKTLKFIKKQLDSTQSDRDTASNIQTCLRNYLETRFGYPFKNCAASEIEIGFDKIFQGLMSDEKENAIEDLTAVFVRTDFIRYGKENHFFEGERPELFNIISGVINTLENRSEQKEEAS